MKLQDGFTNHGEAMSLSRKGVLGKGSNTDGHVGPLTTPSFLGTRDHPGGGQPTPPTLPLVQHAGALECSERAAYYHR